MGMRDRLQVTSWESVNHLFFYSTGVDRFLDVTWCAIACEVKSGAIEPCVGCGQLFTGRCFLRAIKNLFVRGKNRSLRSLTRQYTYHMPFIFSATGRITADSFTLRYFLFLIMSAHQKIIGVNRSSHVFLQITSHVQSIIIRREIVAGDNKNMG